jgi:hypothetical protein
MNTCGVAHAPLKVAHPHSITATFFFFSLVEQTLAEKMKEKTK